MLKYLIFIFSIGMYSAQTRVIYILQFKQFKTDSLYQNETFYLDKIGNESVFYSADLRKMDSAIISNPKIGFNLPEPKNEYWIKKDISANTLQFRESLGMHNLVISDKLKIKWKLLPENKTIGTHAVKKASCSFGGREWVAWYEPEIPIQDGPYKFAKLPGLIFEISDSLQEYTFSLQEITTFKGKLFQPSFYSRIGMRVLPLSIIKYQKLKNLYNKNPEALFQNLNSSSDNIYTPEVISMMVKGLERKKEKKINFIEWE